MFIILQKLLFIFSLLLGFCAQAGAQPKFKAIFTPAEIGRDEYTTLRIIIENASDIRSITPPRFKDLNLVGGPQQEFGESTVDDKISRYVAISYILQPRRTGTITLAPATVLINGKKHTSDPIKLLVKKYSSGSANAVNPFSIMSPLSAPEPKKAYDDFILKKGEHVVDKVSKNMHLLTQADKKTCYVGEPVVASYKLYTRLKNESRLSKNPSFNGFSVIDLQRPDETGYARETLHGRDYNVYTIRRAQLYPLQDGTIELEPATVDNRIRFLKEGASNIDENINGFLNDFSLSSDAVITEAVSLSSKPVSITVKALPEKDKPAFFNGAVGTFEISATLEKNKFTSDEAGKLYLVVKGSGNLQLVTVPDIKWPQQLEVFEPNVTDQLEMLSVPVSGRKIFEISFTVQTPGTYQVPPIDFAFFDPASESYKVVGTKPISFSVQKGSGKPTSAVASIAQRKTKSFSQQIGENRGWVVVAIAFFIGLGLFFWIRGDKKQQAIIKAVPSAMATVPTQNIFAIAAAAVQNPLSLSEECMASDDCRAFYTLLNREFKLYLSAKFSLGAQELTAKKLSSQMDKAGLDNELSIHTQQLLQDIEWQLYTPFERNEAMQEFYSRCQEVIQSIHTNYHPVSP